MTETLPRLFGDYVLTAALGEDALGRVYRALRLSDRAFVRLRVFETPEISEDAVLDSIQENGEVHGLLKNPAISRGVQMDSVDGVPFLAWSEENGRTLDALLARARELSEPIPIEHALLIAEKTATALDHAYNTSIDGERTLHGLVWPGFISLSDDGETRLTGFGLASGFLPSLSRPRVAAEVAPYLAPEERAELTVGRNADVFSVAVILLEMLTGRFPSGEDPAALLREAPPLPPEVTAVLRVALADRDARYQSAGELRRELGKLLFSGPYAPSTFNLAYYVNGVFRSEIAEENAARAAEASLDPDTLGASPPARRPKIPESPLRPHPSRPGGESPPPPAAAPPAPAPPGRRVEAVPLEAAAGRPRSRAPLAIGISLAAVAAVGGGLFALFRRPPATQVAATARPSPAAAPPTATPDSPSTASMSEAEFQQEVSRRLAEELKKVQEGMKSRPAPTVPAPTAPPQANAPPEPTLAAPAAAEAAPTAIATSIPPAAPTAAPEPARIAEAEVPAPRPDPETPPAIRTVVKPRYPPVALAARIGGTVVLRVLVSETGTPAEVVVMRGAPGGLTEAAVAAVRRWTFVPGRRGDTPVKAWTTVPIPFQP